MEISQLCNDTTDAFHGFFEVGYVLVQPGEGVGAVNARVD
jgi:hypothetical protein